MKLHAYILCLDAMPYIKMQVEIFRNLNLDWTLHCIEGVADSVLDTSWVAKIAPRFSTDGTTEYLTRVSHEDRRIRVYRRQLWPGKVAMVNAALSKIEEPCVLMQIDADEIWTPEQIEKIVHIFSVDSNLDSMRFFCRFYLGQNIVATGENVWSNRAGEWHRAWRFQPGMLAAKHEPPILQGIGSNCLHREKTRELGLVFEHYAYALRKQIEFKEKYYKYSGLTQQWERLQANTQWPIKRLADFLPFVGEGVGADKIKTV